MKGLFSLFSPLFLSLLLGLIIQVQGDFDSEDYQNSLTLTDDYMVYWTADTKKEVIKLAFVVNTLGWIGFGLGEPTSGSMPGSDIMVVSWANGHGEISDHYATEFSTPPVDDCSNWKLVSAEQINGMSIVEVQRNFNTNDEQDRVLLPGRNKVVFAYGLSSQPSLAYHQVRRGALEISFFDDPSTPTIPSTGVSNTTFHMGNYQVPPQKTTYVCRALKIPLPEDAPDQHVIQVDPFIDPTNDYLAHHMLIHICANLSADSYANLYYDAPGECISPIGNGPSGCTMLLYGWALGSGSLVMPPEAGFRMGWSEYAFAFLVIEMHYDNPGLTSGLMDDSGITVFYTPDLRPYDAGTITMGDPLILFGPIPPGSSSVVYEATCPSGCTQLFPTEIHVFSEGLHMHEIGSQIWNTQYRNDELLRTTARAEFFNFNFQQLTPVNYTIQPGDRINLHCIYDSTPRTAPTYFGVQSTDEMCMTFFSYYPRMQIYNEDLSYCGYFNRFATVCGSNAGVGSGAAYLAIPNPQYSDVEEGTPKIFGTATECENEKRTKAVIGVTIVIVLIAALVGLLGFVYYRRNRMQYQLISDKPVEIK